MKAKAVLCLLSIVLILFAGCSEENDNDNENGNGVLQFMTENPWASYLAKNIGIAESFASNPALTGDTTATYMTSMNFCIGDVWVAQGEVKAGNPDNLEWVRLTTSTNTERMLFEDYTFPSVEIPSGTYQSIKITFRNVFYRHVQLISDPSVSYELLETMGSWTDPCDVNDTTWAETNYFGPDGNHILNDNDVFELVAPGERLGGFTIEADETVFLSWRLGAGVTEPCINYLIDANGNREWDCGIDYIEDECPPEMQYMWDFVVEY